MPGCNDDNDGIIDGVVRNEARVVGVGNPNCIMGDADACSLLWIIMLDGRIVKSYIRLGFSLCLNDVVVDDDDDDDLEVLFFCCCALSFFFSSSSFSSSSSSSSLLLLSSSSSSSSIIS